MGFCYGYLLLVLFGIELYQVSLYEEGSLLGPLRVYQTQS